MKAVRNFFISFLRKEERLSVNLSVYVKMSVNNGYNKLLSR